jgi:hypothetical protein
MLLKRKEVLDSLYGKVFPIATSTYAGAAIAAENAMPMSNSLTSSTNSGSNSARERAASNGFCDRPSSRDSPRALMDFSSPRQRQQSQLPSPTSAGLSGFTASSASPANVTATVDPDSF